MRLTENAEYLLRERYLLKDKDGNVKETPRQMFNRVAKALAEVELQYGKSEKEVRKIKNDFASIMSRLEFLPNSPCLYNAGTELSQLSACFSLPIEDSIDGIFSTLHRSAKIFQSGGGVGYNFSYIRPKDDVVRSTQGTASGPISFMNVYNEMCETIKSGSRRRGAMMGILNSNHPDILDFIVCKEKEGRLSNFNISVGIDDRFMNAVMENGDYELINPRNRKPMKKIKARAIWNTIITMAWKNGEPGVLFWDTINRYNPVPGVGRIDSCNPCSEVPMIPYNSCCLGSINLSRFVRITRRGTRIDWDRLRNVVHTAVRFLDNIIDANRYIYPEIETMTKGNRMVGLGVMGWADTLILMGVRYDSDSSIELARSIMKFINDEAVCASKELAKEKGSFPNKPKSVFKDEPYMRNATVTSIAPTGSLSIIAGCSQSIEPIFSVVTRRNLQETLGKNIVEINSAVRQVMELRGMWSDDILKSLEKGGCLTLPKEIMEFVRTAHQIAPEWHVRMQAAFQEHTSLAVSKTVNLPNHATPEDVENVFMLAYRLGCKGITVYRDGSRYKQLLSEVKCVECGK